MSILINDIKLTWSSPHESSLLFSSEVTVQNLTKLSLMKAWKYQKDIVSLRKYGINTLSYIPQASTLTQNDTGPVGPVTPSIYWSCKKFTGPTLFF